MQIIYTLMTYTDKLGRKVLERRASDEGNNDTYYVYNDLGQLRFVLPPEYQNNSKKAIFGYEYRYDDRGNIVKKFLPQCGYIQYWYDNDNRLIYMQDGRMREKGLYRFYLYDKLSRVVVEGTCTSCNRGKNVTRTTLDTGQSGFLGTGYIIGHDLKLENPKLEVVNYYDNYDYLNLPLAKTNHGLDWQQQITSGTNTTGLVTGTYSVSSDNSPLLDVFCYNAKGQVIQSYRVLSGNSFLKQNTKYTFTGKQENVSQLLFKNGRGYTTETVNSYNKHNDQLESTTLSVNGTQMKVSSLEYDDLGRIKSNKQGQTSTEYTYNLRGWTTDIVNPKFEEHLTYNDGSLGTPYFSGNISTQQWKTADDNILRGYKFTYDKLNRLTNSEYGEGTSLGTNQERYSESIQGYTANGAITKILRNGLMQNGSYGAIDDLSITLNGNQLSSIEEKVAPVLRAGSFDFRKVSPPSEGSGEVEYRYDENGALIYDANRGITSIEYDLRNNPRLIQFSDGSQTEYVYSALGEKLKTIHRTATLYSSSFDGNDTVVDGNPTSNSFPMPRLLSSGEAAQITDTATCQDMTATTILSIDSTEYIGSFIFENGHADKYLFPGGYYSYAVGHPTSTGGDGSGYYYYLTDHLGNNRVVVNDNGDIEQTTHYYPFGAIYADAGKSPDFQKFKYTGKELDLTHGLNTYDHGARQNYSILGVWDRVDPMAENYYNVNPYSLCNNNPISFIDPNGTQINLYGEQDDIDSYLKMLHDGTGYNYSMNSGSLICNGIDKNYTGNRSQTLQDIITAGINSEEVFGLSLVNNDDNILIDSYTEAKIDISDLSKIGDANKDFQAATIGHFVNEVISTQGYNSLNSQERLSSFKSAHEQSLNKEGQIYGEMVKDESITRRTGSESKVLNDKQDLYYDYNNTNRFVVTIKASVIETRGVSVFKGVYIPTIQQDIKKTGDILSVRRR